METSFHVGQGILVPEHRQYADIFVACTIDVLKQLNHASHITFGAHKLKCSSGPGFRIIGKVGFFSDGREYVEIRLQATLILVLGQDGRARARPAAGAA